MPVMYREPNIIKKSKDGRVAAVDMASELLNSRVLLLEGEVNDVTCNGLIKSMLVLEHQSATEPITLIINSPGGSVTAGLALIDTMQSLDCPVITVGEGVVASMAAVILACGDRRQVYRHTQVLIHQLMGGTGMAQQTDIEIAAQHTAAMRAELDELLAAGFTDSFRCLHPADTGMYSWWSMRFRARERNAGWRIDYFLVSDRVAPNIKEAGILMDIMGSDHCPVSLDIEI